MGRAHLLQGPTLSPGQAAITSQHNTTQHSCRAVPSGLAPLPAAHYEEEALWPSYPCLFNGSPVKTPPSAPRRPRSHRVITPFISRGTAPRRAVAERLCCRGWRWDSQLCDENLAGEIKTENILWSYCLRLCASPLSLRCSFWSSPGAGCDLI